MDNGGLLFPAHPNEQRGAHASLCAAAAPAFRTRPGDFRRDETDRSPFCSGVVSIHAHVVATPHPVPMRTHPRHTQIAGLGGRKSPRSPNPIRFTGATAPTPNTTVYAANWWRQARSGSLNETLRPNSYLALSDPPTWRVEDRTFICSEKQKTPGPPTTGLPGKCARQLKGLFAGLHAWPHHVCGALLNGPLGSPIAHIGVELSDSPYVAVNMKMMTRAWAERCSTYWAKPVSSCPACTRSARPAASQKDVKLALQQGPHPHRAFSRNARFGPLVPVMVEMRCWAKNVSRCASHPSWANKVVGLPSTCPYPRRENARGKHHHCRSRQRAEKPILRC